MDNQDKIFLIRNMLSGIDTNNFSIKNAIKSLSANIDVNDIEGHESLDNVGHVERQNRDTERQDSLLQSYEYYLDKQLPAFLRSIDSMVNDYSSAMLAINQFDMDFFANIPMSLNAKQSIAGALMVRCKQYTGSEGNTFWKSAVDGNSDVLAKIIFYANPDTTLDFESN